MTKFYAHAPIFLCICRLTKGNKQNCSIHSWRGCSCLLWHWKGFEILLYVETRRHKPNRVIRKDGKIEAIQILALQSVVRSMNKCTCFCTASLSQHRDAIEIWHRIVFNFYSGLLHGSFHVKSTQKFSDHQGFGRNLVLA